MTGSTTLMIPRALFLRLGWAGKRKDPSRVREVCARVEDGAAPYGPYGRGHCGPARLLPIITAVSMRAACHTPCRA